MIAGLRSDKDALETALYEQQQVNSNLETRKEQLEGENQELIVKKESLQSKISALFICNVSVYVCFYALSSIDKYKNNSNNISMQQRECSYAEGAVKK